MIKRKHVSFDFSGCPISRNIRNRSWIYFRISGDAHLVGGDVLVDDEVPTVTS
jgi:hypothetical protein